MKRITLAALAAFVLLALPVSALSPSPLSFFYVSNVQVSDPVEQQTELTGTPQDPFPEDQSQWVINPFKTVPCAWDVDDHWTQGTYSSTYLEAGTSVIVNECLIAEGDALYETKFGYTAWWPADPRPFGLELLAPSPDLDISACFSPPGTCVAILPHQDSSSGDYIYRACFGVRYDRNDPALAEIAESQGGLGVRTSVSLRFANLTTHTIRRIHSQITVGPTYGFAYFFPNQGCTAQSSYPITWTNW